MIYLSQMLDNPVYDLDGERIGRVNDLGIATGEVFPRVTSLAVEGPGKTPFMISWRKYVGSFDDDEVRLKVVSTDIRFSYLQPNEVLIARDLLNKQIVDTRGMRVVRVNDLKLSDTSSSQLRLLGAEVGVRGILRSLSPAFERAPLKIARVFGKSIPERIIAWNYMDLVERDLSNVKLSVSHKTLDELHPADVADIIERLDPRLRGQVFAQLDDEQAADAMAELDDDQMAAEIVGDMEEATASRMLSEMDPDDAAELVSELDYDKAEKLLRLMGVQEQKAIRQLLGYREDTAGRIMTSEFVLVDETGTVDDAITALRGLDENFESVRYVYTKDEEGRLAGAVSLNDLIVHGGQTVLSDIAESELVVASPDDDQEDVAKDIAKYNLLAMPVVDDNRRLLGIVTVDDALDVLEEEHEEDLQIAGAGHSDGGEGGRSHDVAWLIRNEAWFFVWMAGTVAVALLLGTRIGLIGVALLALALPVAVIAGNDAASYSINSFIAYDPDDEDAPSMVGFAFKGLGLGLLFAGLVALVAGGVVGSLFGMDSDLGRLALGGVGAAAAGAFFSFAMAPATLRTLRWRDERNLETSGTTLALCQMVAAVAVFVVVASSVLGGWGI